MSLLLSLIKAVAPYSVHIAVAGVLFVVVGSLLMRRKLSAHDIASFATTTGIFFTFFGIVLALGGLDTLGEQANANGEVNSLGVSDLQNKVTALLGGIFVAFIPSIFGAGVSVCTHVWPHYLGKPVDVYDEKETDLDVLILQELKKLNANLVGDSETSLTTRLEKFQLKVTENQDALRKEFKDFSEKVANEIIDALSESMSKLNEKLGEQFGDNFAKFADVIPKLLEWQEHYRETIENTQKQLTEQSGHLKGLLDSLELFPKVLAEISDHLGKISVGSNTIDKAMKEITVSLTRTAEGVVNMKVGAEQFQSVVAQLTATIEEQVTQASGHSEALEKSATSLVGIAESTNILDGTAKQLNAHMDGLNQAINTITSGLGAVERLSDTLQGKAESIEGNMQKITEGVTKELARNLRGISEALVRDYQSVHDAIHGIKTLSDKSKTSHD